MTENSLSHERKLGREPSAIVFVPTATAAVAAAATPPPHIAHSATPKVDTRLLSPPRFPEPGLTPSRRGSPSVGGGSLPYARRGRKESLPVRGRGVARALSTPSVYVRHIIELGAPWWPSSVP